jgi:hypothetical protein
MPIYFYLMIRTKARKIPLLSFFIPEDGQWENPRGDMTYAAATLRLE